MRRLIESSLCVWKNKGRDYKKKIKKRGENENTSEVNPYKLVLILTNATSIMLWLNFFLVWEWLREKLFFFKILLIGM